MKSFKNLNKMETQGGIRFLALIFGVFASLLQNNYAIAGSPANVSAQSLNNSNLVFRENKGQLMDENNKPLDIPYYGKQGGVSIYCKPGMLSFAFTKTIQDNKVSEATGQPELNSKSRFRKEGKNITERAEMELLNANLTAEITASDQQAYYENYYNTGNADHGIINVHTYNTITYNNIYPHIDMVLQAKERGMEYSFIVHPGGNVADIQIQWNGLNNIQQLENGAISYQLPRQSIEASFDPTFTESAPFSYQQSKTENPRPNGGAGREKLAINSKLIIHNSSLSFHVSHYDKSKTLIIDPTLSWGTYFGGNGYDVGYAITHDGNSNVCITGTTGSTSGIATSGAYQTTSGGSYDAFLAQFNSSGALAWATYYGGGDDDIGQGIATDANNNVYITGYTFSTSGIATSGTYQTSNVGDGDAFVAKFTSSGSLVWGTYYGAGTESGQAITADANNNVYITGYTASNSGIASSGAHQTSYSGGEDAFIAKFTSDGNLSWGTYYGGASNDFGYGITSDVNNNIYITGQTASSTGISTSGAYKNSFSGGTGSYFGGDAFVAKFSSSGSLVWGTYYGGSDDDKGSAITTDANFNVYITGLTSSSTGIATTGAYQTSYAGNVDAFVAEFSKTGNLSWGTYYGNSGDDEGYGITTYANTNVYVTGLTTSSEGMATSGAYQVSNAGGYDIFVGEFSRAGNLLWASYYGGTGNDEGYGINVDTVSNIYITGYSGSSSGIATLGASQSDYAGTYDAFVAKFKFGSSSNDAGIPSIKLPNGNLCPGSQTIKAVLENYGNDTLKSDDINWTINGTAQTAIQWTGSLRTHNTATITMGGYSFSPGSYTIKVWSSKPNNGLDSVPGNDTSQIIVTINPLPAAYTGASSIICAGSTATIGGMAVTGDIYSWKSNPKGFFDTLANPTFKPAATATYYLTETVAATGCNNTDSVEVTVNPLPNANAGTNAALCFGGKAHIGDTAVKGDTYSWVSLPSGFTSTLANPVVSPTLATIYYLTETISATGCGKSDSVIVTMRTLPVAYAGRDTTICLGSTAPIGGNALKGNSYSWSSKPSGFADSSAGLVVQPTKSTTYYVTASNSCGSDADTVIITVNPVPNAHWSDTIRDNGSIYFVPEDLFEQSYFWHFGNDDSSTILGPVFTYHTDGIYQVGLKVTNTYGCSVKFDSIVYITNALGIAKAGPDIFNIKASPNPFTSAISISYSLPQSQNVGLTLTDITGKTMATIANENQSAGQHTYTVDADKYNIPAGIYFIHFTAGNTAADEKIMKIK